MDEKKRSTILSGASIGVAVGAIGGGLIGHYVFDNLAIGVAIGVSIGVVLVTATDFLIVRFVRKKTKNQRHHIVNDGNRE